MIAWWFIGLGIITIVPIMVGSIFTFVTSYFMRQITAQQHEGPYVMWKPKAFKLPWNQTRVFFVPLVDVVSCGTDIGASWSKYERVLAQYDRRQSAELDADEWER